MHKKPAGERVSCTAYSSHFESIFLAGNLKGLNTNNVRRTRLLEQTMLDNYLPQIVGLVQILSHL